MGFSVDDILIPQSVHSGPGAPTFSGNMLQMHILGPHPSPIEPETLEMGSALCGLTSPLGDFDVCLSLRDTALEL